MPTVVTESDLFAATMQRPNNGELADATSLLTPIQVLANSRRYLYNRVRALRFDVSLSPYNAAGNGSTDDTAAIQAALNDASGAGGGGVFLPGNHRLTGRLVGPPAVRIYGTPGVSILAMDHASEPILAFTSGTWANQPSIVDGLYFTAQQDNTGAALFNDAATAAQVIAHNCYFGAASHVLGRAVDFSGDSDLVLHDNYLTPRISTSIVRYNGGAGIVEAHGNRLIAPTAAVIAAAFALSGANMRAMISRNFFDYTRVTVGGTPIGLTVTSGYAAATCNQFKGSVAAFLTAFVAGTGAAMLRESGNVFTPNTVIPYGAAMSLGEGSSVDVTKHQRATGVGTTFTWPDDVQTLELEGSGTVPLITLPSQIHTGRRIRLLIKNASGSTWGAIVFTPTPFILSGLTGIALNNGETTVFDLEVASLGGAPNWTIAHQSP